MIFYSIGKSIKNFVRVKILMNPARHGTDKSAAGEDGTSSDGYRRWYYKGGKIKAEVFVKNGKMEGIANLYYENGNIKAREFYQADQLHGLAKWYYETGELKSEKYYKDGQLTSIREFDKSGKIINS